jgi:hypothetical protein
MIFLMIVRFARTIRSRKFDRLCTGASTPQVQF